MEDIIRDKDAYTEGWKSDAMEIPAPIQLEAPLNIDDIMVLRKGDEDGSAGV